MAANELGALLAPRKPPDSTSLRVGVPTLVIWGMFDPAMQPGQLGGLEAYMADLTVVGIQTPAPPNAHLYIIWPNDGQRIKGAFWVRFGLRNMGVTRAGDNTPNVGHHHLLVDVNTPLDPNEPQGVDTQPAWR